VLLAAHRLAYSSNRPERLTHKTFRVFAKPSHTDEPDIVRDD